MPSMLDGLCLAIGWKRQWCLKWWDMLYHLKPGLMTIVQRWPLPEEEAEPGDLAGACHFSRHLGRVLPVCYLPPLLQISVVRECSYLSWLTADPPEEIMKKWITGQLDNINAEIDSWLFSLHAFSLNNISARWHCGGWWTWGRRKGGTDRQNEYNEMKLRQSLSFRMASFSLTQQMNNDNDFKLVDTENGGIKHQIQPKCLPLL